MVTAARLPIVAGAPVQAYRLVNSRFPPIALFDDVADADEFDMLYRLQALTNPRLQNEVGALQLIALDQIPFGIVGCSYATAPFTHVNADGSRFSDGSYGVLYLADTVETAIAEVHHHQNRYWAKVAGLNYERFVFRSLVCDFNDAACRDATGLSLQDAIYEPDDYSAANALGAQVRQLGAMGLLYHSVRSPGNHCWALMTPRPVASIIQAGHYEMIWNGGITSVNRISNP